MGTQTERVNVIVSGESKRLRSEMRRAQNSLRGFQKTAKAVASSFGLLFGGQLIIRGITSSIRLIGDFEEQMSKVRAISGATEKEFRKLTANALDLGRVSKFTASEIAEMQETLARLGLSTNQIILTTDAVRQLATAAGEELAPAAEVMVKTMNAFGLQASESTRVANVMAESFAGSALKLEDFAISMGNVGATGKAAGFSLEQVTALLGILTTSGIQASKSGTDLRKIFTEISLNGLTLTEALNKILGAQNKVVAGFEQFGQRAQTSGIILSETQQKIADFTESLSDANQEMSKMVRIMEDNLNTDFKLLNSAFQDLVLQGSALNKVFRGTVQLLTEIVKGNFSAQQSIDDIIETFAKRSEVAKEAARIQSTVNAAFASGDIEAYISALDSTINREEIINEIRERQARLLKENNELLLKAAVLAAAATAEAERKAKFDDLLKLEPKTKGIEGSAVFAEGDTSVIDEQTAAFQRLSESVSGVSLRNEELINSFALMDEIALRLQETIRDGIGGAFEGLAETIGGAISGVPLFGQAILKSVAGFMKSFGRQLIAIGIAKIGLDKLFASVAGGPIAVAAGVALLAVASALSSSLASQAASLSGGGGGGGGRGSSIASGRTVGLENQRNQEIKVGGEFILQGNTLVALINNQNQTNSRTGGQTVGG